MSLSSLETKLVAILDPIPGSNPCGESIRYTPLYDSLQEARSNDDQEQLPEGVWQSDLKKADWPKVADLCLSTLSQKSKDLQIVAWLIEALFFMEGLKGLSRGLKLLNDLSQKFWEKLYPLPEEGDLETRLSPYDWLDYHLPTFILSLTVTSPSSRDLLSYTLADWIDTHLEGMSRKKSAPVEEQGRPTFTEVLASLKKTPLSFYENLEEQTRSILALSALLNQTVGEKVGEEATLFYRFKGQLNLILKHLPTWKTQCFRKEEKVAAGTDGTTDDIFQEIDLEEAPVEEGLPQNLSSRKAAYSALGKIAEFLLAQDPHSPTPYLLRQALAWEEKSLPEVYAEWAQDPQALMFLMRFLGVK